MQAGRAQAAGLKQVVDGGVTVLVPSSTAASLSAPEKKVEHSTTTTLCMHRLQPAAWSLLRASKGASHGVPGGAS